MTENKIYVPPANRPFLCKIEHRKTYQQLGKVVSKFSTYEKLCESIHDGHTQKNEGLNNAIARVAPKFKHFGATMTLATRINLVVAITNLGYKEFFLNFLPMIGVALPTSHTEVSAGIERFDRNKKQNYVRKVSVEYKRKRKHKIKAKIRQQIYAQRVSEQQNYGDYVTGVAIEEQDHEENLHNNHQICTVIETDPTNVNDQQLTTEMSAPTTIQVSTRKTKQQFCKWCQKHTNHSTWRSKNCIAHQQYQQSKKANEQLTNLTGTSTGTTTAIADTSIVGIVPLAGSKLSPLDDHEQAALNMLALATSKASNKGSKNLQTQNTEKCV